jgi:hypothetical protein
MSKKFSKGLEILNITVDVGGGKQDKIIVYENDEANIVARDFALKHSLSQKLEIALSRNISDLLRDITQQHLSLTQTFTSKTPSECRNYGEKLYVKGLRHKEQAEANKQLLKIQLEKKTAGLNTFHPVISSKSKQLAKDLKTRSESELRRGNHSSQTSEAEYTFAPKLNEKSLKLAEKNPSSNRIQELYDDGKLKKQRILELNLQARKNEFPFKPNGFKSQFVDTRQVVERLASSKKDEEIEELRKKYEVTRDPNTGQVFFQPNIGKSYRFERMTENIWESLYRQQKKTPDQVQEFPYNPIRLDSRLTTEKILMKVKIDRFLEIFNQLRPDENGFIVYENIVFNEVEPRILKVIMPLLDELQALAQPLNFEEFADSMERLLRTLNQPDKDLFLLKPKRKSEIQEGSLKKSFSHGDCTGLYQRCVEKKCKVDEKMQIEREKLKIVELQGCTFQPRTIKFPAKIFNK